jgi:membrane-associated phospholipid phosphatase
MMSAGSAALAVGGASEAGLLRAPYWQPAHRVIAFWLLATAPLLLLPGPPVGPRLALLALHLVVAAVLLWQPTKPGALPGRSTFWVGVRDWLPMVLVPMVYWEVPLLAEGIHGGAVYDGLVQQWEALVFGGQPSQSFAGRWPSLWLSEPMHAAYLSYYLIYLGTPVVLYVLGRRGAFRRVVFTLVVTVLAHQAVFVLFPVLGPRYIFPAPSGPLEAGPLYQLTHWVLETGSSPGTAFPSSHVGIAVAVTIALFREGARAATWVAAVTTLLAIATVYGGFHYAVDAIAGIALGTAAALAAPWIYRRLRAGSRGGRAGRKGTSRPWRGSQPIEVSLPDARGGSPRGTISGGTE